MKKTVTFLALTLLTLSCQAFDFFNSKGYTETKYPIILVHGVLGFDSIAGADHFYGIPDALQRGGATVFVAQMSPTNSTEVRGEQLLEQVEQILAVSGAQKVNLIGHSHGAPTARYVASVAPDYIASVSTVGGANKGAAVADIVRSTVPKDSLTEAALAEVTDAVAALIGLLANSDDLPSDGVAALESVTTAGVLAFNKKHPQGVPTSTCGEGDYIADNGVYYYSWSGVATVTNLLDISDPLFAISGALVDEPNDGMLTACSSHLGKVIRDDYKMNHLDEINQMFGLHHLFETDPVTLFRQHANRLQKQGL